MYRVFRSLLPHPSYFETAHTRVLVRGLDFNPIQTNFLSFSAVSGEMSTMMYVVVYSVLSVFYISMSGILKTLTSISWNRHVHHILASSSSTPSFQICAISVK